MIVPVAATITIKIAIVAAQISSFLRKDPKLQSYIVKNYKNVLCNSLTFNRSLGLARHSKLRKKKCVGVGQLFDALVQRSADAVTCAGARPQ